MTTVLFVMLIWAGETSRGGGAVIQGFQSIQACEKATAVAHKFFDGFLFKAQISCVEMSP